MRQPLPYHLAPLASLCYGVMNRQPMPRDSFSPEEHNAPMIRLVLARFVFCFAAAAASHVHAQVDRVYTFSSDTASAGTVSEASKNGVSVKSGQNVKQYKPSEIRKIVFQGDPRELTRGREFAIDGQYQQAVDELKGIDVSKINRALIQADAEYYLVLSRAKLALGGQGDLNGAVTAARNFARKYSNSYHFYSVAKLLGDLAVASGAHDQAMSYYEFLSKAPSTESKIQARYLIGIALLEKGDVPASEKAFSDVAGVNVQTTEILRFKKLAKAGQAVALSRSGKGKEGLSLVDTLIAELDPTDIEMSAKIYNAQAACFEAMGDIEGAIMGYLHTHLMFSGQPDAHAQSLVRLIELWPKVGRNERASAARQELQQRYPRYAK